MNKAVQKFLEDRYFLPDENSWEELATRVSKLYPPIKDDIINMNFVPSTPTLMNACTNGVRIGTLSSCFPMDIGDSIEEINEAFSEITTTTRYGGGVGLDVSVIRSGGEIIKSVQRPTEGVIPFINMYNSILENISQSGARRGAGMVMLDIDHPDILTFIRAKEDVNVLQKVNFSVRVSDRFYKQLMTNPDHVWKVQEIVTKEWKPLMDDGKAVTIKQLWDEIITKAWETGEPGIFNKSIAERQCSVTNYDEHVLTNVCQEYPNVPYTSCCLGSIKLSNMIVDREFNWDKFSALIEKATLFLNSVLDNNTYPIDKIRDVTLAVRPIGLGIMGLAHMFYKLGIPYNSKEAVKMTRDIVRYLTLKSMETAVGNSYSAFDPKTYFEANKRFFNSKKCREIDVGMLKQKIMDKGIRNSAQTSLAPCGSISHVSQTSSGIEPVYGLVHKRRIEVGRNDYDKIYIVDSVFEDFIDKKYLDEKKVILENVVKNNGSCQNCDILTNDEKKIFVVVNDLNTEDHLNVLEQAAVNTSLSVSKTINMPKTATVEDVSKAYIDAHDRGVIGVTVYRDGSRENILQTGEDQIVRTDAPKRPKELQCDIHELTVDKQKYVVLIGFLNNRIYECFVSSQSKFDVGRNKNGIIRKKYKHVYELLSEDGETLIENINEHTYKSYQTIGRLISAHLRHGTPLQFIVRTLNKESDKNLFALDKAISRVLKKYIKDGEKVIGHQQCPECGSGMVYVEGCVACANPECGHTKCN